jgi:SP family arabinose:H+ symporter-like MFS transporter
MKMTPKLTCFLVGALGGSLFGYNTGIIGGLSGPLIKYNYFPQDVLDPDASTTTSQTLLQGALTACILVGAFVGSIISVPMAKKYSTSLALTFCGVICVATTIIMGVIDNFWGIIAVRTVLGISVGFTCTLCPQYVNEHAPSDVKGRLGTVFQLFICFSIFIAQLLNWAIGCSGENAISPVPSWKFHLQFALGAVPGGLLTILAFCCLSESKEDEAITLSSVSNEYTVNHPNVSSVSSFQSMQSPVSPLSPSEYNYVSPSGAASGLPASSSHLYSSSVTFKGEKVSMFTFAGLRWWLVGIILASCNQLTGINGIMFYAPEILSDAITGVDPLILTFTVIGLWNFLSVFVSLLLVDRFSRHALMLSSLVVMIGGCCLLATADLHAFGHGTGKTAASIIALVSYILAFECGPGPLFWIMAAETYPDDIADVALSVTNVLCWAANILISFTFPFLNNVLGSAGTFYLLGGIGVITFIGVQFCVPRKSTMNDGDVYKRLEVSQ